MIDTEKKSAKANLYITEHYDRMSLAVPKGKKQQALELAKKRDMSLTKLIVSLIDAEIEKESTGE